MKIILTVLFAVTFMCRTAGQDIGRYVFTSDIDNFWQAYDSCLTTSDSLRRLHFIQKLYIDKGTQGLKAFMKARDYSAELWVRLIYRYPKFWNSIRPNTLSAKSKAGEIQQSIQRLKTLYPDLKEAKIYFTIGGLRSGGTTANMMILIGAEIATGDAETDVSEFPNKWLEGVFKNQQPNNIVPLNIHEYVHTQQKGEPRYLMGKAIKEGSCDFIMELVVGKPLQNNYIVYGNEHETELKEQFKADMNKAAYGDWLYNGSNAKTVADLGYFMGYAISRNYYYNSSDRKMAIKDIIELNYSNAKAVEEFLEKSQYYSNK